MAIANVSSTLDGISADFHLQQMEFLQDLHVIFKLEASVQEDMDILFEIVLAYWTDLGVEFRVEKTDLYNFNDLQVTFEIITGGVLTDISVMFSVVRPTMEFVSYIFQKLYCTSSEILGSYGDTDLANWNVKPNKTWYVSVNYGIVVLYDTQADMEEGINAIATGEADEDLNVYLISTDEYDTLSFYYLDYPYHLSIEALVNGSRFFKILPLTDMSEIRHPIYNNSNIALSRGEAELDLHTYAEVKRDLVLGVHLPTIEIGDIIQYESVRRASTILSQVLSQSLSGVIDNNGQASLINTIKTSTYTELVRR